MIWGPAGLRSDREERALEDVQFSLSGSWMDGAVQQERK